MVIAKSEEGVSMHIERSRNAVAVFSNIKQIREKGKANRGLFINKYIFKFSKLVPIFRDWHISKLKTLNFKQKNSLKNKQHTLEEIQLLMEHYCAYQDRCHQEVEQKLFDYQVYNTGKEQIIVHLIINNYLNEERFAKSYTRGKLNIKHWGRTKIKVALHQRKISEYNILSGLKEINEDDYLSILSKEFDKKSNLIKEQDLWKRKKKIVDYLMQKGFEFPLIEEVWNKKTKGT